jgi:hypothetical protein
MIATSLGSRGMRVKERDVIGDRLFNPFFFDGQVRKIAALELRALPGDRSKVGRWRKQLLRHRLSPQAGSALYGRREVQASYPATIKLTTTPILESPRLDQDTYGRSTLSRLAS